MIDQISIYTENSRGAMRAITRILADAGIDINGFVTNDSAEYGTVRMLVSDSEQAMQLLSDAGYLLRRTPVLAIEISDEVGSLDRMLAIIDRAYISIDYLYATFDRVSGGPIIVIRSGDLEELESLLEMSGFRSRR